MFPLVGNHGFGHNCVESSEPSPSLLIPKVVVESIHALAGVKIHVVASQTIINRLRIVCVFRLAQEAFFFGVRQVIITPDGLADTYAQRVEGKYLLRLTWLWRWLLGNVLADFSSFIRTILLLSAQLSKPRFPIGRCCNGASRRL